MIVFKLFISYRRQESAYATSFLTDQLRERFGDSSIFMDVDNIPIGEDFKHNIEHEIQQSDVLLVMIGNQWLTLTDAQGNLRLHDSMDFVRLEVETALKAGLHIIPILLDQAQMPSPEQLPDSIKALAFKNAAEIRAGTFLNQQIKHLIEQLSTLKAEIVKSKLDQHAQKDSTLLKAFKSFELDIEMKRLRTGFLLGFVMTLIAPVLDFLIQREDFYILLEFRIIIALLMTIFIYAIFTLPLERSKPLGAMGIILMSMLINGMIYLTQGGIDSPYYFGIVLLIIAIGIFMPWSMLQSSVVMILIIGSYFTVCWFCESNNSLSVSDYIRKTFELGACAVVALWSNYFQGKQRLREFLLISQLKT